MNFAAFHIPRVSCILFVLLTVPSLGRADSPNKDAAVAAVEEALKKDPRNSGLYVQLGLAYRNAGDIHSAQNAFEKARSIDANSAEALYMLGLIYEKKGMKGEAQRAWQDYLRVSTDHGRRAEAEKHLHHLRQ